MTHDQVVMVEGGIVSSNLVAVDFSVIMMILTEMRQENVRNILEIKTEVKK